MLKKSYTVDDFGIFESFVFFYVDFFAKSFTHYDTEHSSQETNFVAVTGKLAAFQTCEFYAFPYKASLFGLCLILFIVTIPFIFLLQSIDLELEAKDNTKIGYSTKC